MITIVKRPIKPSDLGNDFMREYQWKTDRLLIIMKPGDIYKVP